MTLAPLHKATLAAIALTVAAPWTTPTDTPTIHGTATYYRPGLMQQVITNRGLPYPDGVALNRAADIGRQVWLQWADGTIDGPLPVVDCAQRNHYNTREQQGRIVEVSAELAQRRGFYGIGPAPVTVWLIPPPPPSWTGRQKILPDVKTHTSKGVNHDPRP